MSKHDCNKEGEIGMMVQKINDMDTKIDRIETKLDKFIDNYPNIADNKYATKEEVTFLRSQVVENKREQVQSTNWTKDKIFDITWKLAVITGSITIGLKQFGVI